LRMKNAGTASTATTPTTTPIRMSIYLPFS